MRREWGDAYQTNLRTIFTWLDKLPAAERERIESAEDVRGTLVLNNPQWLRHLLRQAQDVVPASSVVEEIARIEGWMRADPGTPTGRKYWGDEKVQARLRELYQERGNG